MQAIWLENQELSFRADLNIPELDEGEALIRLRLAGICSTDLEMVRGYYPFTGILGHEFIGEIVEAPDPNWQGKRVTGEINIACGTCATCRRGDRTHCENRATLGIHNQHGCFAEYFKLPVENLHLVPEHIPDEVAVFIEPIAAALEIQQQIQIRPDDLGLIIGAGRLGLLIAQTLALTGCDLRVVVRHSFQKEILEARGIATLSEDQIPSKAFDWVIEATGAPGGFELGLRAVRPRGVVVLKSTYAGDLQANFSEVVVNEVTLIGSRCGPFGPAIRLLAANQIDPKPLINAVYALKEGVQAFDHASQSGVLKILLKPEF